MGWPPALLAVRHCLLLASLPAGWACRLIRGTGDSRRQGGQRLSPYQREVLSPRWGEQPGP
jgi:hypothetical protein